MKEEIEILDCSGGDETTIYKNCTKVNADYVNGWLIFIHKKDEYSINMAGIIWFTRTKNKRVKTNE